MKHYANKYDWLWALSRLPSTVVNTQAVFVSDELLHALKKIRLTFIQLLLSLLVLIGATGSLPACAQEAQAADLTMIAAQSKEDSTEALPVEFMNRHIFTIRSGVMGFTPKRNGQ